MLKADLLQHVSCPLSLFFHGISIEQNPHPAMLNQAYRISTYHARLPFGCSKSMTGLVVSSVLLSPLAMKDGHKEE
jgi:hypothetical protein